MRFQKRYAGRIAALVLITIAFTVVSSCKKDERSMGPNMYVALRFKDQKDTLAGFIAPLETQVISIDEVLVKGELCWNAGYMKRVLDEQGIPIGNVITSGATSHVRKGTILFEDYEKPMVDMVEDGEALLEWVLDRTVGTYSGGYSLIKFAGQEETQAGFACPADLGVPLSPLDAAGLGFYLKNADEISKFINLRRGGGSVHIDTGVSRESALFVPYGPEIRSLLE